MTILILSKRFAVGGKQSRSSKCKCIHLADNLSAALFICTGSSLPFDGVFAEACTTCSESIAAWTFGLALYSFVLLLFALLHFSLFLSDSLVACGRF